MSTKALHNLTTEPLIWMLTPHGDGYALGWKGAREFIERAYILFVNYYQPPKHGASPQLIDISDNLSYIYLPNEKVIRQTLTLFFHVHAVRDGDVEVKQGWIGVGDDAEYAYEADEAGAEKLAIQSAETFFNSIQRIGFIPSLPKPTGEEYALGHFVSEERFGVEDLAGQVG